MAAVVLVSVDANNGGAIIVRFAGDVRPRPTRATAIYKKGPGLVVVIVVAAVVAVVVAIVVVHTLFATVTGGAGKVGKWRGGANTCALSRVLLDTTRAGGGYVARERGEG